MYDKNQKIRNQDIDQIMPKSILKSLNYNWDKINSIANYQLIDYGTNRGVKNGKPFKEWMGKYVRDKRSYIKRHLIPDDESIWTEDKFDEFLKRRSELIFNKISKYLP